MITISVTDPATGQSARATLDEDELTWACPDGSEELVYMLAQLTEEFEISVAHGGMPDHLGNLARYVAKALHGKVIARTTEPEPGVIGRIYGHA